ncbi:TatD family hydrolase [Idiomarina xiamenensis]|uniref:Mg-dependent Dnase-like protein n=1 Tax=Idiomarina xiamenensis 10-D-4 TaxID=740709 RepID=K2KG17_9GAMM|nr:TatD family hydrolase [Idiomarina xiamenensis]EKE86958.1 Mg-dependent Dnase-like protein [Idiomarina xiamenensis 10-D-4]
MFVDSHCHLDRLKLDEFGGDLAAVVSQAEAAGVERMLCVSVTLDEYPKMRAAVEQFAQVSMSCGVHPLYVADQAVDKNALLALAADPRVVAIGETGLDYFYDKDSKAQQQAHFANHVEVAVELNKPLIIHTRDAQQDTLSILKAGQAQRCRGVLHCFTESTEMAKQAIDELDFMISISGIVSFRNAEALRATVKALPLDKLLIETDSPWLAPVPHRGKQNQPAYVADVAKWVADVKGERLETVARVTRENYYQLFGEA